MARVVRLKPYDNEKYFWAVSAVEGAMKLKLPGLYADSANIRNTFVLMYNGRVNGALISGRNEKNGLDLVNFLAINKDSRGHGFGTWMMNEFEVSRIREGSRKFGLFVKPEEERLVEWYGERGYVASNVLKSSNGMKFLAKEI